MTFVKKNHYFGKKKPHPYLLIAIDFWGFFDKLYQSPNVKTEMLILPAPEACPFACCWIRLCL